jgi:acetoin utilization protein AcuC
VELVLPALAEAFRPTFIVSQHGCDSHALDPLAHLRVTTASYARACALIDRLAHAHCAGRWLATGGGGYDAYRVVPRSWAIIWLAQAHIDVPAETPTEWRERWAEPARAFGQTPLPVQFIDPPGTVQPDRPEIVSAARTVAEATLQTARALLEGDRQEPTPRPVGHPQAP